jgi:hypothetical protein
MNDTEPKDGEPPKGRFAAFWTSLPGVLTAAAGFIGAIAAILALFVVPGPDSGGGGDSGSSRAEWADKVNPICSDSIDAIRQASLSTASDASTTANYLHQVSAIGRDMTEKVRAVDAPAEDQGSIDRMTLLWDEQTDGLDTAANAIVTGDQAGFATAQNTVEVATQEADTLAASLGVTSCAQSPQVTFTP